VRENQALQEDADSSFMAQIFDVDKDDYAYILEKIV
jgi:hypothetical protein